MRIRFGAAALAAAAVCLYADNYPRQAAADVQHYVFRVALRDDTDEISGETSVTVRFQANAGEVALDLASASGGKGMTVSEVTSGGVAIPYRHEAGRLVVTPAGGFRSGELRTVDIKYHGVPAGGLRAVKNRYGERCFFSDNWPDRAHQWLPTIDHPYDKATSEFVITAPAKYQVVANGALVEEIDRGDGFRVTHWSETAPIATWLNNIGVAQFASRHFGSAAGVPLQTWVYHQDRDAGMGTFEAPMRQAIEFFNDHIGPYPYEKLAGVQAAGLGSGGMENASAIFYGDRVVNGRPAFSLVAHETAHQWFGDSVTESDWDDVWLSEGFATYFALLATEHYEGRDAFVAGLKRSRAMVFSAEKRLPDVAVVQNRPWKGIPNTIVYEKGGWVLHMLRGQIGTERFWNGIREYYKRYRDANASTADFRRVMEETSGGDLGWFFQQWVYRAGSPVVEGGWSYDPAAKKVSIDFAQKQPGAPYRLPIEIELRYASAPARVEKVEFDAAQGHFEIASGTAPESVEPDPHTWLLMDMKFARR